MRIGIFDGDASDSPIFADVAASFGPNAATPSEGTLQDACGLYRLRLVLEGAFPLPRSDLEALEAAGGPEVLPAFAALTAQVRSKS